MDVLFSCIAAVGRAMPHGARRFVLDRLGLSRVFGALAEGKSAEAVLDGRVVTYNPLLHGAIIRGGEIVYEEHVAVAVRQNLRPENVFYDVGANIGVFSVIAESIGARAYAFEPEENNLLHLRRNVSNAIDMAIGAKDGTATFDRRGGAFSGRISSEPVGKHRTVAVRAIDSLVAEGWPVPHLIKIDVEGAEGEVLEGAIETLRNHQPVVICELHGFSDGPKRARNVLESAGYEFRSIGGDHIICIHPETPR